MDCPLEALLTPHQRELLKIGYRFSVRGGQTVCTFLTESGEIPCLGERETIKALSSLLEGGINIFLGYSIYEVVMELLKSVTMNFTDNNFFVSLVHGMIEVKLLFPEVKKDASLEDLISSSSGQPASALDTPEEVCENINLIVRRKFNFEEDNLNYLCNNFAVISNTFFTSYIGVDNVIQTPSEVDERVSIEEEPYLPILSIVDQQLPSLEEQVQQRPIHEIYSFVYLYVTWKGMDVLEVKLKAISKFREKQFMAKSSNINQTLLDFYGYIQSNIDFFPNPVLVSLCPDGAKFLDLGFLLNLFVGHFDLWTASGAEVKFSLEILKTDDKSKVKALYRETCDKTLGEYASVLWTMQEIHSSIYESNNFEDLPLRDFSDIILTETISPKDLDTEVAGRPIETHITGGSVVGASEATPGKHVKDKAEAKPKTGSKSVYSGHSFIYMDLKMKGEQIEKVKVKAESKYREKYFRTDGKSVKKALTNMVDYLLKNDKYPKPLCITTSEEELDFLTSNLKIMGLLGRFLSVFCGWVNLSSNVDNIDSRLKYNAFSKSGRSRLEKDYAAVFGKLIGDHQSSICIMQELHLVSSKKLDYKIEFQNFSLLFPAKDSWKEEEEEIEINSMKRKSEEFSSGQTKKIKEEPSENVTTLEELSCSDYNIKMEDLKQEYVKKQELCLLLAKNVKEDFAEKDEFSVEALDTVEIEAGQTKSLVGRILCFSDQMSEVKLKLLTHPTLLANFAPSLQFVRSRATPRSEEDLVKVFHVVLHMTNLSEQDIMIEKETILGSACIAGPEDLLLKGRKRTSPSDALPQHTIDNVDIADISVDVASENPNTRPERMMNE